MEQREPINPAFEDSAIKTVEVAKPADIEGIIAVQDSRLVDRLELTDKKKIIEENGVLIYRTTEEELRGIIDDARDHVLLVSKEGNQVIGFGLCYSLEKWISTKPDWKAGLILDNNAPDIFSQPTLYFRQIAALPNREGVGKRLELEVFRIAKSKGYKYVVGDILKSPVTNMKSMNVHLSRGFVPIGTIKDGDLIWTLLCKEL